MSEINFCPECGKSMAATQRCGCGWMKPKKVEEKIDDKGCQYQLNSRRCPLPGTICPNPFGKNWYCPDHWRYLGDHQKSVEFLNYAEKHYHEILEKRRDWRSKLFEYDPKN